MPLENTYIGVIVKLQNANNWSKAQMLKIISGYLHGLAAYWFEENVNTITYWNSDSNTAIMDFYAGKFKRLLKKVDSSSVLLDKYTVRLFLNGLKKNIIPLVTFSHPKNIEEAIDAAKQIESGQYYKQQSPILTQSSESNNAIDNLTKQMKHANEAPVSYPTTQDQQYDELEQVLDDYEEEELSEIEAYMTDSQEEYEDETDLLPLDYNS
ncbi:6051_t:CDS:2 [Funneliformis caledonium]|uniref:6051_t:CDS:1 n=1 Tax=Funneliformis caledonium TaxID=1117310 RepID=A0A9N8ZUB8_9GLOM|nr:6051_t:CDS:2 [Funneliformis caledonium]